MKIKRICLDKQAEKLNYELDKVKNLTKEDARKIPLYAA
jgi:hypothetical protein